jgi:hypothetical protein
MNTGIVLPGIFGFALIFYSSIKIKYPEYEFIKNRRIRTIIKVIGLVEMIFFIFGEMMIIDHGTSLVGKCFEVDTTKVYNILFSDIS